MSFATTPSIKLNSLFNLTKVVSSTLKVGLALLVVNLGLAIRPWSAVFPFPPSLTSISNVLTPLIGRFIETISSAYFITFVVAKVFPSPITLNVILELLFCPIDP